VNRIFRALLPALFLVSFMGCGSDEPALKDLSEADRAAQVEKQKAHQEQSRQGNPMGQGNKDYKDAAKGGSGPQRGGQGS